MSARLVMFDSDWRIRFEITESTRHTRTCCTQKSKRASSIPFRSSHNPQQTPQLPRIHTIHNKLKSKSDGSNHAVLVHSAIPVAVVVVVVVVTIQLFAHIICAYYALLSALCLRTDCALLSEICTCV